VVECPACRKLWDWPSIAEDERRRKEEMRERAKAYYWDHREEILAREHRNRAIITAKRRERNHRKNAHLHPTKTCPICGTHFRAEHRNHKYCSALCRSRSPQLKKKNYEIKQRAKRKDASYLKELESVAKSVGALEHCKKVRDETECGEHQESVERNRRPHATQSVRTRNEIRGHGGIPAGSELSGDSPPSLPART
jgi:DNA repair exonuclease SbcCD ATPase subunit